MQPQTGPPLTNRLNRLGPVFWLSVALSALFVLWGVLSPGSQTTAMSTAMNWITAKFGWVYLTVPLLLLVFLVFLAFSRYGRIRLGSDTDRPEFTTHTWIAMILCAVMGIGLVSYGVAEPISHFTTPPHGLAEPGGDDAAVLALQYSFYDWGLHAWAVFAVFGLAIGYSTHRKGRPGLISSLFTPLLGRRVHGPAGKAIDVFTVFATLFGTTTSLGLGAMQIDSGLAGVTGSASGSTVQIAIIIVTTLLFTASAVSGLHRGIRFLSETSLSLAVVLFVFVAAAGSTVLLASLFLESVGTYISDFVRMSTRGAAFGDLGWMQSWTYFMMAWWVAWGAFVGVFLARISRGRTIREFIGVVLLVPSLAFFAWFTVFGGSAIVTDLHQGGAIGAAAAADLNDAFPALLATLPLPEVTTALLVLIAAMFFVSGADANTFVLGMLTSDGDQRPRRRVLVIWGAMTGLLAIILLLSGGLAALQQMVIVSSAPFLIVLAGLLAAFWKDLRSDPAVRAPKKEKEEEPVPVPAGRE
ncbi:BCCT family transporter [Spinactinospora alkalitolerans]